MKNYAQLVTRGILTLLMASLVACPGNPGGGNSAYRIELRYSADFPPRFKPAFEAAAQRWQSIITADVPDVGGSINPAVCDSTVSGQAPLNGVDDLVIYAGIIPFDADKPDLLGQAGPCYFRKTSFLTIVGTMAFVDNKMDGQPTDRYRHPRNGARSGDWNPLEQRSKYCHRTLERPKAMRYKSRIYWGQCRP
jgi:hypothetical protein